MKEQSHKAEMATALRGDFARLRARGVATTLPTPPVDVAGGIASPPTAAPSAAAVDVPPALAAEIDQPDGAATTGCEPVTKVAPGSSEDHPATSSWLDRLRRR